MIPDFERATRSYFGIPEDAQATLMMSPEGLGLEVFILLTDADMPAIADRMKELASRAPPVEDHAAFLVIPTVQEVMANPQLCLARPEYADILHRAAKLSAKVRDAVKAEAERVLSDANNKEAT